MRGTLLSVVVAVAIVVEWLVWVRGEATWPDVVLFVIGAVGTLAAAWTRWRVPATVVVVAAFVGAVALPEAFNVVRWFVLLPLLVDANLRRPTWLGLGMAVSMSLGLVMDWWSRPGIVAIFLAVTWFLSLVGMVLRSSNAQVRRLHELETAQLQAEAAAHRRRLSADMHDYVASSVTRATAITCQVLGRDGLQAPDREALRVVEAELVAAIDQVRQIARLLEEDRTAPPASADRLAEQLAAAERALREAGFAASVHATGEWVHLAVDSLAAQAVLHEGVANAIQHGRPGGVVQILVNAEPGRLQLAMVNQLGDSSLAADAPLRGNGLKNLGQRVIQAGGELEVACEEGTWILRIQLPGERAE
ncbi:MAG TPA: hypothetical protein PKE40_03810 [Arachnia sp.]|nr:hypothetical protein [Arachnia sp.]HMT85457.1 hypothetical protein [Arachnia sp.]